MAARDGDGRAADVPRCVTVAGPSGATVAHMSHRMHLTHPFVVAIDPTSPLAHLASFLPPCLSSRLEASLITGLWAPASLPPPPRDLGASSADQCSARKAVEPRWAAFAAEGAAEGLRSPDFAARLGAHCGVIVGVLVVCGFGCGLRHVEVARRSAATSATGTSPRVAASGPATLPSATLAAASLLSSCTGWAAGGSSWLRVRACPRKVSLVVLVAMFDGYACLDALASHTPPVIDGGVVAGP